MAGLASLMALPLCHGAWEIVAFKEFPAAAPGLRIWKTEMVSPSLTLKVTGATFHQKSFRLRVEPNSAHDPLKLAEVAARAGALAGCNASYFHGDGRPIGLVISDGRQLQPPERARLLSGMLVVRGRDISLARPGALSWQGATQAVQAGPWLVENSQRVAGLEATKLARRTVVATDGNGRWALMAFSAVTLDGAAEALLTPGVVPGWRVRDALNLDGGGSTALWALTEDGPLSIAESGTVANFLLLERMGP